MRRNKRLNVNNNFDKINKIIPQLSSFIVNIDVINLNFKNTRFHDDINIKSIMNSLQVYGQRKPVVVSKRTRIVEAGNGMVEAAKALGWTKIAAIFIDDDEDTAKGYEISDNRTGELSEWEFSYLRDALKYFDDNEFDLEEITNFTKDQFEQIMARFETEPGKGEKEIDETIETIQKCPKCGYEWS